MHPGNKGYDLDGDTVSDRILYEFPGESSFPFADMHSGLRLLPATWTVRLRSSAQKHGRSFDVVRSACLDDRRGNRRRADRAGRARPSGPELVSPGNEA